MILSITPRTAACAALVGVCLTAQAQPYPVRPIRLLVPLAPGGGNDTTARLIGAKLAESLGQQVVVENRPGGAGVIAGEMVVRAPADGHTLYLASTTFTAAPSLVKKLPFDTLRDFAPVTRLAVVPAALIMHASLPVNSAQALIALAKKNPGQVTFGSAGVGSGSHLSGELFKLLAKVDLLHVPYKGSSRVTTALLSGEVMLAITNPISSLPHVKAGRIKNLGITSLQRWPLFPEYPTLNESGVPGYELLIWNGIVVRAGTPQPIVERLHRELVRAANQQDFVSNLASDG
ncbi:MAG TPA: tripartite tricarboxylate transporter substrate binding protein, partial [Burkholderiales bacterium]|nr:tripartite tricarboxylate transporter substrate binding protein [Burkholderiales bacterium]